jgi:nitroreductase
MVRDFADRAVAPEVAERILRSGLRAPSAGFAQGFSFLVLTGQADLERFWPFVPNQTRHTPGMMRAPLVVVPIADKATYLDRRPETSWPAPYWSIDTGMAAMLIQLQAIDEGLDSFFFWLMPEARAGRPDSEISAHVRLFRDEFGIPDGHDPIGAIAIGYRAPDLPPQKASLAADRRTPESQIHRGRWGCGQ